MQICLCIHTPQLCTAHELQLAHLQSHKSTNIATLFNLDSPAHYRVTIYLSARTLSHSISSTPIALQHTQRIHSNHIFMHIFYYRHPIFLLPSKRIRPLYPRKHELQNILHHPQNHQSIYQSARSLKHARTQFLFALGRSAVRYVNDITRNHIFRQSIFRQSFNSTPPHSRIHCACEPHPHTHPSTRHDAGGRFRGSGGDGGHQYDDHRRNERYQISVVLSFWRPICTVTME